MDGFSGWDAHRLRLRPVNQGFVLYAPNVHTGGGFVLLNALLSAWKFDIPLTAFLDKRARGRLPLPEGALVSWVEARLASRLRAEIELRAVSESADAILCFHGLPPLLTSAARKVIVFEQNRLHFEPGPLLQFPWKTQLRLTLERAISRLFRHRVSEYVVQTPSMERALVQWFTGARGGRAPAVRLLPFAAPKCEIGNSVDRGPEWDFVYVADGEAHKNHRALLAAWRLLAQEGLRPSLALTLGSRDKVLTREVAAFSERLVLRIHNLGEVPREEILALYGKARAMIFPSTCESFGLPLIEATHAGLPILASELDFVRDVCVPTQTFDPHSPMSIARAVKRFLGIPEATLTLRTPVEFWEELLQKDRQ